METVLCSAIKVGDKIWYGHRHSHALQALSDDLLWEHTRKEISAMDKQQGFVTNKGRYVSREEGLELQKLAGIESVAEGGYRGDILFSEDLY